ncbi:MAG: hypothetical protein HKN20_11880 [Gemmatimonadetes bacterium]|nr:hypothetical protein [Gemmatimonadota bacterium]
MNKAISILFVLLLAGGCFFEPREAEQGTGGQTEVCSSPSSPDVMPQELIDALQTIVWDRFSCLYTEDFVFIPDAADVVDLTENGIAVPEPWGVDEEFTAFNFISACHKGTTRQAGVIELVLDDIDILPDDDLSLEEFTAKYTLTILSLAVETGVLGEFVYEGVWEITTVETDEGWKIAEWVDLQTGGENPTWGFFKGQVNGGVDFCDPR